MNNTKQQYSAIFSLRCVKKNPLLEISPLNLSGRLQLLLVGLFAQVLKDPMIRVGIDQSPTFVVYDKACDEDKGVGVVAKVMMKKAKRE